MIAAFTPASTHSRTIPSTVSAGVAITARSTGGGTSLTLANDRNPQTFVKSIFWAKPEDYRKATQRIYNSPGHASFIELPLVTKP